MWFAFGAAIVLQFVMPFIYPLSGHDAAVHLNWLGQFPRLFREGNLYPRWMPDSFWGFGSPAFYFYPPLAYWSASLLSFILPDSPVAIYQTLGFLATVASVGTCYLYLRSMTESKRAAFIGALFYGVFPYRLLDLYLRNAIGEHIAFIFLPLIFLTVEMALRKTGRKDFLRSEILAAIGWSGILLSNIPMSVIALYCVPVYSIIRASEKKNYVRLFFPAVGACIGAAIAAVYLLPIAVYTSAAMIPSLWNRHYTASNWGYSIIELFYSNYRINYTGMVIILAVGIWLCYRFLVKRAATAKKNLAATFSILLAITLALEIPYLLMPLWTALPLFSLIQFAYRWNSIIAFAAAVYIALYFTVEGKYIPWLVGILSTVTIIIAVGYFITMHGFTWHNSAFAGKADAPEYLSSRADTNFTRAKKMFAEHAMDDLISSSDPSQFHIISVSSESIRFSKGQSQQDAAVIFHRMYFPSWQLRSSAGNEIPVTADSIGRMTAVLPTEAYEYTLSIEKNEQEKTGAVITFTGIVLLAVLSVLTIFWRNPKAS